MSTDPDAQLSLAKGRVFRLFRYRPRSEQEIESYLRQKGFSADIITRTTEEFKRLGLVDDRLFTRAWIRSRVNKPFGYRRIFRELKAKGITEESIREEWNELGDDYNEYTAILRLAQQRCRHYHHVDRITARRRLYGYLLRRGFPSALVQKALFALFKEPFDVNNA